MESVNVVKIGYYDYAIEDDVFLSSLLTAVASGKIKFCEKKYIDGKYKVTIGNRLDVSAEFLEVINEREAELADLRARLKKLEG